MHLISELSGEGQVDTPLFPRPGLCPSLPPFQPPPTLEPLVRNHPQELPCLTANVSLPQTVGLAFFLA